MFLNFLHAFFYPVTFTNIKNNERLKEILKIYLNYFEGIAIGIKYKIHESKFLYDYIGHLLPTLVKWTKEYIKEKRNEGKDETIYCELEELAEDWERLTEELKKKNYRSINKSEK